MDSLICLLLDFPKKKSKTSVQIYIVACGSAYHVGIAAQYVIEDLS